MIQASCISLFTFSQVIKILQRNHECQFLDEQSLFSNSVSFIRLKYHLTQNIMQQTDIYAGVNFHIYPLELFILFVGFIFGVIIGSLNDKIPKRQQNNSEPSVQTQKQESITHQQKPNIESPLNLILSYSLSTGQSFEVNGKRFKLFKGHMYNYLPLEFGQSQQERLNDAYERSQSCITKKLKQNQWVKLYNPQFIVPRQGKFYFNILVVKNEYFVRRQTSQKSQSNLAVSRTDIIIGFIIAKPQPNLLKLTQEVDKICQLAEKDSNGITGIVGYGFNGKIYSNGDLRTEEKVVRKNKTMTVLINRDDGFVAYEVDGETVGFSVLPKYRTEIVPFVEMFAVGSSVIVSS